MRDTATTATVRTRRYTRRPIGALGGSVLWLLAAMTTPMPACGETCSATISDLTAFDPAGANALDPVYRIPVVLHLFEPASGWEFTQDQVRTWVAQYINDLNSVFRARRTGFVDYSVTSIDTKVEFFVADRAPDGTPAEGITWHIDDGTATWHQGQTEFYAGVQWDPARYANVYLVADPEPEWDYAYGWAAHPWGLEEHIIHDGVVNRAGYLSAYDNIQSSEAYRALVARNARLMAYYLGLYFTYDGYSCEMADGDTTGDLIRDTAPDALDDDLSGDSCAEYSRCPAVRFPPCENFMSGPHNFAEAFTPVQASRMRCAIRTYRPAFTETGPATLAPVTASALNDEGAVESATTLDFNADGYQDILLVNEGQAPKLFANLQGVFENVASLGDLATAIGVRALGACDLNRDGHEDVVTVGDSGVGVYTGDGSGLFWNRTSMFGLAGSTGGTGVSVCDANGDAFPDVYVLRSGGANALYRNVGGAALAEAAVGLETSMAGTGCAWAEWNGDGRPDVVAVGPGGLRLLASNGPMYTDETAAAHLDGVPGANAVTWLDYNHDAALDLFVVSTTGVRLYIAADNQFADATAAAGLAVLEGGTYGLWGDFNNDGYLDLYMLGVSGGNRLLVAAGEGAGGGFVEMTSGATNGSPGALGRGALALDYDQDGRLDIYVGNQGANVLLHNEWTGAGTSTVGVLQGVASLTDGVGADVHLDPDSGVSQWRHVGGGDGRYRSAAEVHFGLPAIANRAGWTIAWNSGSVDEVASLVSAGKRLVFREGFTHGWRDATDDLPAVGDHPDFGAAVAVADYNGDGTPELCFSNDASFGTPPAPNVFAERQSGGWYEDTAATRGISGAGRTTSMLWADFTKDGREDVAMLAFGETGVWVQDEAGGFQPDPALALPVLSTSGGIADFDHDGYIDIGVFADYGGFSLQHNDGGAGFTDVSTADMRTALAHTEGETRGVAWIDYDRDGWDDLFLFGSGSSDAHKPVVYKNNGGTFQKDLGATAILTLMRASSVNAFDNDDDGRTDLLTVGAQGVRVYKQLAAGVFFLASAVETGLPTTPAQDLALADVNNDGWDDVYIVRSGEPCALYVSNGDSTFHHEGAYPALTTVQDSRGVAAGDLDANGTIDLVVTSGIADYRLLMNEVPTTNNWLEVRPIATASAPGGLGAAIQITGSGVPHGGTVRRTLLARGARSQDFMVAHFGLGVGVTSLDVRVEWPSGHVTELAGVGVNRTLTVLEPVAKYVDQSAVSGIAYPPEDVPYSAVSLNFDEGTAEDAGPDLFISMASGDRSYLFQKVNEAGGVPVYLDRTEQRFPLPGEVPQIGLRGASVADYDNDGDADFFAAAATLPRLYRNDPGPGGTRVYHDVADIGDMRTWIDSSWMGAWGDYDRDGWLDLFVVRAGGDGTPTGTTPAQPRLFRNLLPGSAGFGDMTPSVGLQGAQHLSAALSASWMDMDGNESLDLVLGHVPPAASGPTGRVRVYLNQEATSFVEDGPARIQRVGYESGVGYANGVSWADVNQDGRLDLLVSREKAQTESNTMVFTNDGTGHFSAYDVAAGIADPQPVSGVVPFDQDLNGYVDLCWAPLGDTPVVLHSSFPNAAGVAWLSRAGAVGIAPGAAGGLVAQDTNADGDVDLYVGRPYVEGVGRLYYQNVSAQGGDAPANKWVQIRLSAPLGGNNRDGIGATVTVEGDNGTGPIHQVQLVDGGSSRGGQQSRTLTFGLGQTASPVSVTVRWPDGATQLETIPPDQLNRLHVIEDNHGPDIVPGSLQGYFEPGPNGTADFLFEWLTENSSVAAQDQVQIWSQSKPPPQCKLATYPNPTWLFDGAPGVSTSVEPAPGGRYLHRLRWHRGECTSPCYYYWQATSGIGSRWSTYPAQQPWPQLIVFQCTIG